MPPRASTTKQQENAEKEKEVAAEMRKRIGNKKTLRPFSGGSQPSDTSEEATDSKKKPSKAKAEANGESNSTSPKKGGKGKKSAKGEGAKFKTKIDIKARPVVYKAPEVSMCIGPKAISEDDAKKLLGWSEESENVKFNDKFRQMHHVLPFKDDEGNVVCCLNNTNNRFIRPSTISILRQEILRKRWRFNGEPIIVGKTASILNGQHSLIAFILACQAWKKAEGVHKETWPKKPTLEKLVVKGIDESDEVVNTLDTGVGRSLTDVLYRSPFFQDYREKARRKIAQMLDKAVQLLWIRTGASESNKTKVRRTHSESLDFIERHLKLLECVKHIFEESGVEGRVKRFIGPGSATALMYLMGSSSTDSSGDNQDGYIYADKPDESYLDWAHWKKASDFWRLLCEGDKDLAVPIMGAIADTLENRTTITFDERMAIVIKGWELYLGGKKLNAKGLELEYEEDDNEVSQLAETPQTGGIDVGKFKVVEAAAV